jgi:uncharacterized protein YbjT (DUF2867 family)
MNREQPLVLLTGATGYVGGRLLPLLEQRGLRLRCACRQPERLRSRVTATTEVAQGDMMDSESLRLEVNEAQVLRPTGQIPSLLTEAPRGPFAGLFEARLHPFSRTSCRTSWTGLSTPGSSMATWGT